jgi:hypothetical protein
MTRLEYLEAHSRHRALSPAESIELERLVSEADGRRLSQGHQREAARAGVKRDMRKYR